LGCSALRAGAESRRTGARAGPAADIRVLETEVHNSVTAQRRVRVSDSGSVAHALVHFVA